MIELKRSSVEVADGVRQLITNQEEIFNKGFFSTVQLVFAGSDSQGLRYGTADDARSSSSWNGRTTPRRTARTCRGRAARPAAGARSATRPGCST